MTRISTPAPIPGRRVGAVAALVGVVLALGLAATALGHAELVSSDPADGAVLATPPTTITLTFSEGVVGKSSFKLLGPDGATIATATPANDGDETMALDNLSLGPGAYTIEWTSVADDGDIERGTLAFTVSDPTPPPPSASASAPASAAPTVAPSAVVTPSPAPAASADTAPAASSGNDALLPIVAALVLVGVIGFLVLRRNRTA